MFAHTPFLAVIALALQAAPETTEEAAAQKEQAQETDQSKTTGPAPADEPVKEEAKKNDPDEIICRREAVVGSKFKKKICATRAEWQTLADRARDTTHEFQRRGKPVEPVP
ncbi:MAG: hypothetical protein AAGH57_10825 [Pseudomonadota bacterium]